MLSVLNTVARFPAKGQFHRSRRRARAALALGCHRIGCGHIAQIGSGVSVPVVNSATSGAGPLSDRSREFIFYHPARRARLTRREPAVDHDNRTSGQNSFVLSLSSDFSEGCVENRFGYPPSGHPANAQVFDPDEPEVSNDTGRELVDDVFANVGDTLVKSRELLSRLLPVLPLPVLSSSGSSGQFLVKHPETFLVSPQRTWSSYSCSIRQNSEIDNSEVDPDRCLVLTAVGIRPFGAVNLDVERDIPVVCTLGKSGRKNLTREANEFPRSNPAELGNTDLLTCDFEISACNIETLSAPSLLLEAGESRPLLEEVLESRSEVGQRSGRSRPRKFCHPGKLNSLPGIQVRIEPHPRRLLSGLVHLLPSSEPPVIRKSGCPSSAAEPRFLDIVRREPDSVRENGHSDLSTTRRIRSRITSESGQRRRAASSRTQVARSRSRFTWKISLGMLNSIMRFAPDVKVQLGRIWLTAYKLLELRAILEFAGRA